MVSTFNSVLCTLGLYFYVFPACSAFLKGLFETFISLLKPSVYPPSCSLPAHNFAFLLTEKRDRLVLSCSAPSLTHKPVSFHYLPTLPACRPSCLSLSSPVISVIMWAPGFHISLWLFFFILFCFWSSPSSDSSPILLAARGPFQYMKLIMSPSAENRSL